MNSAFLCPCSRERDINISIRRKLEFKRNERKKNKGQKKQEKKTLIDIDYIDKEYTQIH